MRRSPTNCAFCDKWLDYPTTWAVIPDVITGNAEDQDRLLADWPFEQRGAPVWHMHEPISRLLSLLQRFARVCIGSSAQFATVLSEAWERRMDEVWTAIAKDFARTPWVHMLRGMACVGRRWPFASVDSTDVARNHNRSGNVAWEMSDRWNAIQCPPRWIQQTVTPQLQEDMFA